MLTYFCHGVCLFLVGDLLRDSDVAIVIVVSVVLVGDYCRATVIVEEIVYAIHFHGTFLRIIGLVVRICVNAVLHIQVDMILAVVEEEEFLPFLAGIHAPHGVEDVVAIGQLLINEEIVFVLALVHILYVVVGGVLHSEGGKICLNGKNGSGGQTRRAYVIAPIFKVIGTAEDRMRTASLILHDTEIDGWA